MIGPIDGARAAANEHKRALPTVNRELLTGVIEVGRVGRRCPRVMRRCLRKEVESLHL